ncbi:hypothetical protein ISG33_06600 [Glaciecola sp. MH2013]|uniref:hypothetical protein n=1 Tax=Glaciecola sp. MH2013 TaxID=2785524 RepID=UPI00189D197F|nr:hypothetical protein [Glaciecola sp. MH2013]MBF7073066.1 hypothetical protein [Glaciecola sp. MH2013]
MTTISSGVSEQLQADFELLRETVNLQGRLKYSHKTIDKLAQYIVCRNYGKLCLELCYLCWPVIELNQHKSNALLSFFWLQDSCNASTFRVAISALLNNQQDATKSQGAQPFANDAKWRLNAQGLHYQSGKDTFTVSATRVNLLAAFLEWLLSHFHGLIDEIQLNLKGSDSKGVSKFASLLQKKIYDLLKKHLRNAGLQQKYRYIDNWLHNYHQECRQHQAIKPFDALDDAAILAFWQQSGQQEGFVRFQSAFFDMLDYQETQRIEFDKLNIKHAHSFDTDVNDPLQKNGLYEQVSACSVSDLDYEFLCQSPKSLTKAQYHNISSILATRRVLKDFPMSILRLNSFAPLQAILIQRKRNNVSAINDEGNGGVLDKTTQASQHTILKHPVAPYSQYYASLKKWEAIAANALLCCAAVLLVKKDERSLACLLEAVAFALRSDRTFFTQSSKLAISHDCLQSAYDKTVATLTEQSCRNPSFTQIQKLILACDGLHTLVDCAYRALSKNNRSGFQSEDSFTETTLYIESWQAISHCLELTNSFQGVCESLASTVSSLPVARDKVNEQGSVDDDTDHNELNAGLDEIFRADLFIFNDELEKRHGDFNGN